jgi:hypothetical protein
LNKGSTKNCIDKRVYINIIQSSNQILVASCDKELLGMVIRNGKFKLEVKESFYKGELKSLTEALDILDSADIANLIGEQIIKTVIKSGRADQKAVIYIGGVPHLQIVKI